MSSSVSDKENSEKAESCRKVCSFHGKALALFPPDPKIRSQKLPALSNGPGEQNIRGADQRQRFESISGHLRKKLVCVRLHLLLLLSCFCCSSRDE